MYQVQARRLHRRWTTQYRTDSHAQAVRYYECLHTFGRWRKRLVGPDGEVITFQPW